MSYALKHHMAIGLIATFLFLIESCKDPFSYSPFEANVDEALRYTNQKNLNKIHEFDTAINKPFKVALISDSHYHFNNLKAAIANINRSHEYSFIIVTGDITDNGLLKEFEIFQQIMGQARIPYVTVIGNHDHLSNGGKIYQQMYGPLNYSFTFHQVKFIAWDNVEWESEKETDYNWLQQALEINRDEATNEFYHHVIPFSHIPPTDGQMEDDREKFHALLKEHQVKLSVHGHRHTFSMRELYGDGIQYVTVGSPQKRNYAEIAITPDTIVVSKIDY